MSLHPQAPPMVPEETRRVARTAFPKGTLCLRIADALGPVYRDQQFTALFPRRGQPAAAPGRLATVLQFVEDLSDREAADAVRGRIDWKYALGLTLSDPGFLVGDEPSMSVTLFDDACELTPADRLLIEAKRWGSRLRFAIMLVFYRARGRFPRAAAEVDKEAVAALARRLDVLVPRDGAALLPASDDRTLKRQRAEIRALLGFREATVADAEDLGAWLRDTAVARTRDVDELAAEAEARCRGAEPHTAAEGGAEGHGPSFAFARTGLGAAKS